MELHITNRSFPSYVYVHRKSTYVDVHFAWIIKLQRKGPAQNHLCVSVKAGSYMSAAKDRTPLLDLCHDLSARPARKHYPPCLFALVRPWHWLFRKLQSLLCLHCVTPPSTARNEFAQHNQSISSERQYDDCQVAHLPVPFDFASLEPLVLMSSNVANMAGTTARNKQKKTCHSQHCHR